MKWILILLVFLLTPAAHAESPQYKSGLNHTRVYNAPKPKKPEAPSVEKTSVEKKTLALTADKKAEAAEETAADRVWKKYKSIAMGEKPEAPEGDDAKKEDESQKEETKTAAAKSDNKPSKAGFAAILDSYQTNKQSQRNMRSLSFKQPKAEKADE